MALFMPGHVVLLCVKELPVFKFLSKGTVILTNFLDLKALETARFISLVHTHINTYFIWCLIHCTLTILQINLQFDNFLTVRVKYVFLSNFIGVVYMLCSYFL